MAADYRFIVIGCGMMGAAAARHLSTTEEGVALIGPNEPADSRTHEGVFASHYDEGRITRTIDPDPVWAALANRSIARYGEIEARSGIRFYHDVGCLMVAPSRSTGHRYVDNICKAADRLGVEAQVMPEEALSSRFPYFGFEPDCEGVFEASQAGHINPRALVAAQAKIARDQGVRRIEETVESVRDEDGLALVRTVEGRTYTAEKALLAAGGFSVARSLLPEPLQMTVYGRTITFFEVLPDEAERYAGMPSLIYEPRDPRRHIYMLPPLRYPDGRLYLKIGGDPDDVILDEDRKMRQWFRDGGRAEVRDHHVQIMESLVPWIDRRRVSMGACVVAKTPTGYPIISYTSSPRIAVLTGGCGTAAKSSDEIGRLGALLLRDGRLQDEGEAHRFSARFG